MPLKTMVPVSVRQDGGADDLGNRISFVFIPLPCDEPEPLERLEQVKAAMGERKRAGEPEGAQAVLDAIEYAPLTVQHAVSHAAAGGRAFNLVVSNIPGPSTPMYMLGCELKEAYPVVPLADGHALSIGMTTVRDQACFGLYAAAGCIDDADRVAVALDESTEELLAL